MRLYEPGYRRGPDVYVDAYAGVKHGYDYLLWGTLHELGLSSSDVLFEFPDKNEWVENIRLSFERTWWSEDRKL